MDLIGIAQHRGLGIELVESLLFVLFLAELFPRGGGKDTRLCRCAFFTVERKSPVRLDLEH